jgi:hypothetical protein
MPGTYPVPVSDASWIKSQVKVATDAAGEALRAARNPSRKLVAGLSYGSGWSDVGGTSVISQNGMVYAQLSFARSTALTDGVTVMTLPSGFRPPSDIYALAFLTDASNANGVSGMVHITTAGVVTIVTAGAASKFRAFCNVHFSLT